MQVKSRKSTLGRCGAVIIGFAFLGTHTLRQGVGDEPDSPDLGGDSPITSRSEKDIVIRAHRLLGVRARTLQASEKGPVFNAAKVILPKDNTPYLSSHIVGRELWQVEINDIKLELPSGPPGPLDAYDRTFDVLMDGDGRLLKIESRWPDGEPLIPPEPDAQSTTVQLLYSGNEVYHAFPDEPPLISFVEALDAMARDMGNPLIAKQIKAQYVLWSRLDWEPRPMWVITLRGIPPHPVHGPGEVPVHLRDHLRFIVDPETRRWIFATSTPQPDISEDERQAFAGGIPAGTVQFYLSSPADGQPVMAGDVITWQIEAAASDLDPFGLSMFSVDFVQDSTTPNPNLIDIPRADEPGPLDDMAGFNRPAGISNPGPDGYGSGYGGTQIGLFGQKNLQQIGGGQNTFGVSGGAVGQDIVVEDDIGKGPGVEILASGDFDAPCTPGTYTFSIENGVAYLLDVYDITDNYWEVKQATVDIPAASFTFTVLPGAACMGACCLPDAEQTCTVETQADCEDLFGLNGLYHGDDTMCVPERDGVDCTLGACCRTDGICEDMTTHESCTGQYCPPGQNCPQNTPGVNEYMGPGTSCATVLCDPPSTGACCIGEGTCLDGKTEAECNSAGGGYQGPDSICEGDLCQGACCMPDPQPCVDDQTAVECYDAGGNYQGDQTVCAGMDCTTGACCFSTSACYEATRTSCEYEGGLYEGDGTDCTSTFCENCADGGGGARCLNNEHAKLQANDGLAGDEYGSAVAVSGDVAVVGAPRRLDPEGPNGPNDWAGAAYVHHGLLPNACSSAEFLLIGSDTDFKDFFGYDVAIDGDLILVGAPAHEEAHGRAGAAYVFKNNGSGWDQEAELNASDASNGDAFGLSVALVAASGGDTVAVVGAPNVYPGGAAYVFRRFDGDYQCTKNQHCVDVGLTKCGGGFCDGLTWVQDPGRMTASDASLGAKFGGDVDIDASGNTIVVGASKAFDVPSGGISGRAYVFEYEQNSWTEKARLDPQNFEYNGFPHVSVSVSDGAEVVLLGAFWADGTCDPPSASCNSGAAYVYNKPPGGWAGDLNEDAKLTSCDQIENGRFGWSVSLNATGDVALVGAPSYLEPRYSAAYAFLFDGVGWVEEGKLTPAVRTQSERFGTATDLDDELALLGAPSLTGLPGSAYVVQGIGDCDGTVSLDICEIQDDPRVDYPLAHDCCETGHGPGCNDEEIEDCVCNTDPYCCETDWDAVCAGLVDPDCASCGEGNGIPYACEDCPADLYKDGDVGPHDLAYLLAAWGPCPGGCPEDLSGDCDVGPFDLAILLGSWGPCPALATWNGGPDGSGAMRFARGGGNGCLTLEEAVQLLGYNSVAEFIEWVLSAVPPDMVYQVAQFLLWLLDHWPC